LGRWSYRNVGHSRASVRRASTAPARGNPCCTRNLPSIYQGHRAAKATRDDNPSDVTSRAVSNTSPSVYVHVMVANFSNEEIELPKATVLGLAEETSASIVAAINDKEPLSVIKNWKTSQRVSTVEKDTWFQEYLRDRLVHLNPEKRSVLEPILLKYRHVFHGEGSNEFRGTDLAEHKIITGEARPTRKSQYRVPFALRKEMDNQI